MPLASTPARRARQGSFTRPVASPQRPGPPDSGCGRRRLPRVSPGRRHRQFMVNTVQSTAMFPNNESCLQTGASLRRRSIPQSIDVFNQSQLGKGVEHKSRNRHSQQGKVANTEFARRQLAQRRAVSARTATVETRAVSVPPRERSFVIKDRRRRSRLPDDRVVGSYRRAERVCVVDRRSHLRRAGKEATAEDRKEFTV